MKTKFEKLIEHVIAGDEKKARSLFHSIVVDKSRKIYEGLDVDDTERAFDDVEADHTASDETDEFGGDEADDLESDVFADDEDNFGAGDELGAEGETELNPEVDDRVADLESEFDALKAEFEELLSKEEGGEEEEINDFEDEEEGLEDLESDVDDEGEEAAEEEVEDADFDADEVEDEEHEPEEEEKEEEPVDESVIREYVLKVTQGLANSSEEGFVNKKTPVAKDRPDMGGNSKNLNQGGESQGRPTPKSTEMIGDKEVVNRPGRKTVDLKPVPKSVTTKEPEGVNKKSVES